MADRKLVFTNGELYHVFNRGGIGRMIFEDVEDMSRFTRDILEFNAIDPIGSLHEKSFIPLGGPTAKLVTIINFCFNPNHFHLTLRQEADRGIEKLMQRMGGYTGYLNNQHGYYGSVFQGKYKAKHIKTNDYLLHESAYVNLNDRVHSLGGPTAKLKSWTSWSEYVGGEPGPAQKMFGKICTPEIVLGQFAEYGTGVQEEYRKFAEAELKISLEKKREKRELEAWLLE